MIDSAMQSMLGAVRRRLWRKRSGAAARIALWGSCGLMLAATVVHVAVRAVAPGAVWSALAVLWVSALAWVGLRRPSDEACALWADRHLGGASAYGTLLEMQRRADAVPDGEALRWLEHWAAQRAPRSLQLLAERADPARLARPLVATLACAALAAIVLGLRGVAPAPRAEPAATASTGTVERSLPARALDVPAEVVGELASALRSAESERVSARSEPGGPTGKASVSGDDRARSQSADRGATAAGDADAGRPLPGSAVAAASGSAAARARGAGRGQEAGEGSDDRAGAGPSPAPQGTMPAQRHEVGARPAGLEGRADMDRPATFDDDPTAPRATLARTDSAPGPATPPPAGAAVRLTPTRASYVQAWMKASGQHR